MKQTKQIKQQYDLALKEVLKVRKEREKIYGNNWKFNKDWELLALINQKVGRLENFIINRKKQKLSSNEIDSLIDLINYSLFLLENKLQEIEKIKKLK